MLTFVVSVEGLPKDLMIVRVILQHNYLVCLKYINTEKHTTRISSNQVQV